MSQECGVNQSNNTSNYPPDMVADRSSGATTGQRIGGWAIMGHRVGVEALCRSGVDFVGIDAQHGFFAFEEAAVGIQVANLCGVACWVRVPVDQLGWIPRYLDAGADGIIVAMVDSPDQARRAVALGRYQPDGARSYGGGKRNGVGEVQTPFPDTAQIFAMVETPGALGALKELASVPGLAGLYVGPVDLGLAMKRPYPLPADDASWLGALRQVTDYCAHSGIRSGMFATGGDDARRWLAMGFSDVVLSSDIAILRRGLSENLARGRQPITAGDPPQAAPFADPYAGR